MREQDRSPPPMEAALAYSPKDAALVAGLGRTTIYKMVKEGRLELRKVGSRSLITAASLRQLVEAA